MNRRKFGAILLLAPLLWIHIIKVFHSHDWNRPGSSIDSKLGLDFFSGNNKPFTCSICDYHIAKDVELNQLSFEVLSPLVFRPLNFVITTNKFSYYTLKRFDRGPPTFFI